MEPEVIPGLSGSQVTAQRATCGHTSLAVQERTQEVADIAFAWSTEIRCLSEDGMKEFERK